MHIRSVVGIGGIGLLTLGVEVSSGDIITPVLAFASSYYNSNLSPTQAINNAGLNMTSGDILTWTHTAPQDGWQTWITGQGQGGGGSTAPTTANQYIVFDLGNNYDLTDAYI